MHDSGQFFLALNIPQRHGQTPSFILSYIILFGTSGMTIDPVFVSQRKIIIIVVLTTTASAIIIETTKWE
jgi:hypothetical protein